MERSDLKQIALVAAAGIVFYALSFLGHKFLIINNLIFWILCGLTLYLAFKKFEVAVGLAFLELILGSFGKIFVLDIYGAQISLRIALFLIIIGVWIIRKLQAKSYKLKVPTLRSGSRHEVVGTTIYYFPLFVAVAWGIARGFISGNSFDNIFADVNAFLFFAYLGPAMEAFKKIRHGPDSDLLESRKDIGIPTSSREVKNYLAGGIIALWVVTMFFAIGFSYGLFEVGDGFYKWIRDSRLGEVTFLNDQFSRVFLQSHIFALIGIFLFASRQYLMLGILSASIIWVDLSRSYWVGAVTGLLVFAVLIWKLAKEKKQAFLPLLILISGLIISSILLPQLPQVAFGRGTSTADPASSSRKTMLSPLVKKILKNPVLGSGFGTEVTYKTSDPRALQKYPDGQVTTYAFEWGWLDLWVKTGFLGVLAYIGLILAILRRLYKRFRLTNNSFQLGIIAGLIALSVTHIFSPYLNHPLGIGLVLFADSLAESE